VLSVMATDRNDAKAGFSHFGKTTVDLGAPGVDILSTVPGGSYDSFNGTSMATPHVAGAAALVLAEMRGLSVEALTLRLMETVDSIPALNGLSASGGRLNLAEAIGAGGPTPPEPDACDGGPAQIAYNEFHWSENKRVDSNGNLVSATFTLPTRMVVAVHGNSSARRTAGTGDTAFRTGFYSGEDPNVMWTGSYRRGSFVKNGENRTVSSNFALVMTAGEHTVYWKYWISGATAHFDSGALTITAFPCSMGGRLDLMAAARMDITESDPSFRVQQERLSEDKEGQSVTTAE
ncbi:MAG TPA: S8 family serine peptidase, partial [Afifellaceae bacterium]|nr:S8 family serine peptidase [Afifellaceae bacterium]